MGDKRKGYISVWRCIQDNPIWLEDTPFNKRDAWIDLLMMANHEDREIVVNNETLYIRRGQKFTSIRKLAQRWGWTEKRVLGYIKLLKKLGMCQTDSTKRGTLLTIVNYGFYQDEGQTKDTQSTSPTTTLQGRQGQHQRQTNNNVNNLNNLNNGNNIKGGPVYNSEGELLE